jgi:hypothetical protein
MERHTSRSAGLVTGFTAGLLPIAVFYAILFREMRNVPIIDDYQTILDFVLKLRDLPGLGHKLLWIVTSQHLEYKFPVMNAVVALQWAITGKVDFRPIIIGGNLMILAIVWLFWKNCFTNENDLLRRVILFLPICFIFIQLSYGESLDWAAANMDYVPAILFSFAALHFLLSDSAPRKSGALALACVSAFIGYLCFPNAFLVAPIGLALILQRRHFKQALVWCATAVVAVGIYLFKHHHYPLAVEGSSPGATEKVHFYLSLTGGAAENMSRFPIRNAATCLGALLLASFVYSMWKQFYKVNPFVFTTAVWTLGTIAMITQWRSTAGIIMSLVGRYKLYSDLLLVFSYIFAVHCLDTAATPVRRKRLLYAATLFVAIGFCGGSDYFGYKFLAHRQRMVAQGLDQYAADPSRNVPLISMDGNPIPKAEPEEDRNILNAAIQSGIYALPPHSNR